MNMLPKNKTTLNKGEIKTVGDLISALREASQEALITRVITPEFGTTEIWQVYISEKGEVILD